MIAKILIARWGVFKFQRSSEPKLTRSAYIAKTPSRQRNGECDTYIRLLPGLSQRFSVLHHCTREEKPININILGGTASLGQTGRRPWDKRDPVPGTNWDPSLGQTGRFLFTSTVKSPFVPFVPGTGGGSSLGRLSRKGRQKNVYVFSVCCFFLNFKITSTSTERQKRSQNLAPVLVIILMNSLVFSRKIITSTGFYQCCAPGMSAPVVVKKSVSHFSAPMHKKKRMRLHRPLSSSLTGPSSRTWR